jgi:nucleoid-associated protein YgaU
VDQDLTAGNKGYILGKAPTQEEMQRATTRETQVFEVELGRPVKVEKKKVETAPAPATSREGNRGYLTETVSPEISETPAPTGTFEKYTVQKGDTLQKISQKFYGTTKKWMKLYDANKDVLKSPNRVIPGQVLNIPTEGMKETKENLK